MNPELDVSPSGRPDLDEFLLTLGGFLEQKSSPRHPNNLRFLSMFCRSIGASEGHLLQISAAGELNSVASVGLGKDFDDEFNSLQADNAEYPSPHQESFRRKEVIAIVDLKKEKSLPSWFVGLMDKYKMNSMVAVPLLGRENPLGVLTAFYHDVCLFDQNTLGHLMMVGKMIGSAMERQAGAGPIGQTSPLWRLIDDFLREVATKTLDKAGFYQLLAEVANQGLTVGGVITGPVRCEQGNYFLKITGGTGIPRKEINQVYKLPRFIERKLAADGFEEDVGIAKAVEWGSMKHMIGKEAVKYLLYPLICRKKQIGAIIGWVPFERNLAEEVPVFFGRIARIASIGLIHL